jgi:AraC family transcriptional activator of mtrCDE
MEVEIAALTECFVSPGWKLCFPSAQLPAIHYTLSGRGRMKRVGEPLFELHPHTLVIMPPGRAFHIEGGDGNGAGTSLKSKEASMLSIDVSNEIQTFHAGEGDPQVSVICGYFRASYGLSINLFSTLRSPIVEQFEGFEQLADNLQSMLAELAARRVGMRAMTAAMLKQIFVALLRRSLVSVDKWSERFSMLSDPQIARAFADMVEMPGAPHSVQSLSQAAILSRSAFMERFQRAFGQSPMLVLRELRMRHAAKLLMTQALTVDQVARAVGYNSRSSFSRAFREAHGFEPKVHRAQAAITTEDVRP